jgi:hypothetical protein
MISDRGDCTRWGYFEPVTADLRYTRHPMMRRRGRGRDESSPSGWLWQPAWRIRAAAGTRDRRSRLSQSDSGCRSATLADCIDIAVENGHGTGQ